MDKEKIKKEFPETVKIAGCEEIFWENAKIKRIVKTVMKT